MEHCIITIGREYGSGGRNIGRAIAEMLDIAFYDSEMIHITAEKSGFSDDVVEQAEQTVTNSLMYNLSVSTSQLPLSDQVFIAQSGVIKELAKKESCVIVGRCADYALRDHPNCLRVFLYAPIESRIKRVYEEYGCNGENIRAFVRKIDKKRATYYQHFTQCKWGECLNYDLCVNTDIGVERVENALVAVARGMLS